MNYLRRTAVGLLKLSSLYHPVRDFRRDLRFRDQSREKIRIWRAEGCPSPPPDGVKYACIRSLAELHATQILVETGTFYGNAIFSLRHSFREIHSIELAPSLHARCVQDMRHLKHIHLHLGDSAKELPRIARGLDAPALFWLDGHFCSGPSARGEKETPIFEELTFLLGQPAGRNVVLIDDARLFTGMDGYPTIARVKEMVKASRPNASFDCEDDIIRIVPV